MNQYLSKNDIFTVLIETLWNVKKGIYCGLYIEMSINRNIVECKAFLSLCCFSKVCGINRNIVECKARIQADPVLPYDVLIETLWNVKM